MYPSDNSPMYDPHGMVANPQLSIDEVIALMGASYKKLLLASAIGALLGFATWFFFFQYRAKSP